MTEKKRFLVAVTREVTIELDTSLFTEQVMEDFNAVISDFGTDKYAYEQHAEHLAYLATGVIDCSPGVFVEGYGVLKEAGIKVTLHQDIDVDVTQLPSAKEAAE